MKGRVLDGRREPVAGARVWLSRATEFTSVSHPWALDLDTRALTSVDPRSKTFRTLFWQQSVVGELDDYASGESAADGTFDLSAKIGRAFSTSIAITALAADGDRVSIGGEHWRGVKSGQTLVRDVAVSARSRLSVTVKTELGLASGERVRLSWPNEHGHDLPAEIALTTSAAGRVTHWVPPGPVRVIVEDATDPPCNEFAEPVGPPPPRIHASRLISIEHSLSGSRLEVELTRGAAIEGRVVDANGAAVKQASLTARAVGAVAAVSRDRSDDHAPWGTVSVAETDEAGRFVLSGLTPGVRYTVGARPASTDESLYVRDVELEAPASDVELRLVRAGPLKVDLRFHSSRTVAPRDDDGRIENYVVRFERRDERTGRFVPEALKMPSTRLDRDRLRWFEPRPGTWRVVVLSGMRTETASEPVEVLDGAGEVVIPVELDAGRSVAGRVVDGSGSPISGAVVHCDQNGRVPGEDEFRDRKLKKGVYAVTGAEGRFVLPDVPLDATRLDVWVPRNEKLGAAAIELDEGAVTTPDVVLRPR